MGSSLSEVKSMFNRMYMDEVSVHVKDGHAARQFCFITEHYKPSQIKSFRARDSRNFHRGSTVHQVFEFSTSVKN